MCHDVLQVNFYVQRATVISTMAAEISKRQASQQLRRRRERRDKDAAVRIGPQDIDRCDVGVPP